MEFLENNAWMLIGSGAATWLLAIFSYAIGQFCQESKSLPVLLTGILSIVVTIFCVVGAWIPVIAGLLGLVIQLIRYVKTM